MPENLLRNYQYFEQPLPIKNRLKAALTTRNYIKGLDINRFQAGELQDPAAIYNAGYRFVILEATWGLWVPPTFAEFWPRLLDAGLVLLAYGFFCGDQKGSDQADLLLNTVRKMYEAQGFWMPLFSDVEPFAGDGSTVSNRVLNWRAWVDGIRKQITPGSYCNANYWNSMMANEPLPADCLGWPAHWTSSTEPLLPINWPYAQCLFHQIGVAKKHSWCPPVPGMADDVGVDRFYGTETQLRLLGKTIEPEPGKHTIDEVFEVASNIVLNIFELDDKLNDIDLKLNLAHTKLDNLQDSVDALDNGGSDPPPDNVVPFLLTPPEGHNRVSARFNSGLNESGKIVFQVWPSESSTVAERQTWEANEVIQIKTPAITGDNSLKCFEIYDPEYRLKFKPLYVRKDDGTQQI